MHKRLANDPRTIANLVLRVVQQTSSNECATQTATGSAVARAMTHLPSRRSNDSTTCQTSASRAPSLSRISVLAMACAVAVLSESTAIITSSNDNVTTGKTARKRPTVETTSCAPRIAAALVGSVASMVTSAVR